MEVILRIFVKKRMIKEAYLLAMWKIYGKEYLESGQTTFYSVHRFRKIRTYKS